MEMLQVSVPSTGFRDLSVVKEGEEKFIVFQPMK
jgi:hypothetical protein